MPRSDDKSEERCLQCDINDIVREHIEAGDAPINLPERAWPPQRVTTVLKEFIPLEGTNADEETKSPAADVEEVDEGVPLLGEQDEQLDATETISGDIEKEDTKSSRV
jgi:hypothetical protein